MEQEEGEYFLSPKSYDKNVFNIVLSRHAPPEMYLQYVSYFLRLLL